MQVSKLVLSVMGVSKRSLIHKVSSDEYIQASHIAVGNSLITLFYPTSRVCTATTVTTTITNLNNHPSSHVVRITLPHSNNRHNNT